MKPCHEMERHVDPGRDASRCHDLARVDEAVVTTSVHRRLEREQLIESAPVGGRGTTPKKAGRGEDERPGAHTGYERASRRMRPDPRESLVVVREHPPATTARDE